MNLRKIKLLEGIKKKYINIKDKAKQKAIEKVLEFGKLQRAISETKTITPHLCGRCKRHVSRIMLMESNKMEHFNSFAWCFKCSPKIDELKSYWDDEMAADITKVVKQDG